MGATAIAVAADRLTLAARSGTPCAPVRDLIGAGDLRAAYAVQREVASRRSADGDRPIGRKVGLTSVQVQQQLGVDQPDFGVLFDGMAYTGGSTIPYDAVLQPRVEAEVGFVLAEDLVDGDLNVGQVRKAVDYAVAAIEVCGSRIADWDITFGDTVADNASAGVFVLGPTRKALDGCEPRDVSMTMTIDGRVVSRGSGTDCLGDPLLALQWLARQSRDLGDPLRAGELVLSGALGPMCIVSPGSTVKATITGLGSVLARFGEAGRA